MNLIRYWTITAVIPTCRWVIGKIKIANSIFPIFLGSVHGKKSTLQLLSAQSNHLHQNHTVPYYRVLHSHGRTLRLMVVWYYQMKLFRNVTWEERRDWWYVGIASIVKLVPIPISGTEGGAAEKGDKKKAIKLCSEWRVHGIKETFIRLKYS